MRIRLAPMFVLAVVLAGLCGPLKFAAAYSNEVGASEDFAYGIFEHRDVMIAMRDGTHLATNVFLPSRNGIVATGQFPAIVERTPYGKDFHLAIPPIVNYFVPRGYVVVVQDVRGRYGSEGHWRPLRDDGADGFDLLKWIGEQTWSNGKIGTVGTSYDGGTQHALAIANAPNLSAMVPVDAMSDTGVYGVRHSGAFELRWLNWVFTLGNATGRTLTPSGEVTGEILGPKGEHTGRFLLPTGKFGTVADSPDLANHLASGRAAAQRAALDSSNETALIDMGDHVRQFVQKLPLRAGATPLKFAPDYETSLIEALSHGSDDSYWTDMGSSVIDHIPEYKDVPIIHVTGSYDSWGAPVANLNFVALRNAKKSPQRLLFGPWTHGGQRFSYSGIAEFGPAAAINMQEVQLRWFDRWLKGIDNGAQSDPPVRIFVMGGGDAHKTVDGRVFVGGHWRDEHEWPLARTLYTPYYLQADGSLSTNMPVESKPTRYHFDPRHPVPSIGGNVSSAGTLMQGGAQDQRCRPTLWPCEDSQPLSARLDVKVFQTPPLSTDMEVTGPIVVELWASSDSPDTDFTAKLIDVYPPNADYPKGLELNIGDGIIRARYRDSLVTAKTLKPGKPYKFSIELYPTSLLFQRGHRIRVDISSSNFPRYDVNPNTGEPLNNNAHWRIATNSIYHDPSHPSRIVLPVIP